MTVAMIGVVLEMRRVMCRGFIGRGGAELHVAAAICKETSHSSKAVLSVPMADGRALLPVSHPLESMVSYP